MRTGLVEGCAPLTDRDRSSVLGCADRIEIEDETRAAAATNRWMPRELHPMERGDSGDFKYAVFFVRLQRSGSSGSSSSGRRRGSSEAVVRLVDSGRSNRKMLSVKFSGSTGKISLTEAVRTRSFFFSDNERDHEKAAISNSNLIARMEREFVGFWVRYRYEEGLGGTITLGRNGDPFKVG